MAKDLKHTKLKAIIKYFDDNLEFSVGHGSTHPHQLHFEILSELGIIGYILIISNFILIIFKQTSLKTLLTKGSILFLIASLFPLLPSGSFSQVLLQQSFL